MPILNVFLQENTLHWRANLSSIFFRSFYFPRKNACEGIIIETGAHCKCICSFIFKALYVQDRTGERTGNREGKKNLEKCLRFVGNPFALL